MDNSKSIDEAKWVKGNHRGEFDVLILPVGFNDDDFAVISGLLAPNGIILSLSTGVQKSLERTFAIATKTSDESIISIFTQQPAEKVKVELHEILVVEEDEQAEFNNTLVHLLSIMTNQSVRRVAFHDLTEATIKAKSTVISTVELSRPIMANLTAEEMVHVKIMTDKASKLVWLTGGNLLSGERPDYALISGLSRALMLEQPSLKFFTLDLDAPQQSIEAMNTVSSLLKQIHFAESSDFEFVLQKGVLHISRMLPDETMNFIFREKQGEIPRHLSLRDTERARLTIGKVGDFDSLCFKQEAPDLSPLAAGFVEIQVKSVGLNAKVCSIHGHIPYFPC